jgi:hypothetical protein
MAGQCLSSLLSCSHRCEYAKQHEHAFMALPLESRPCALPDLLHAAGTAEIRPRPRDPGLALYRVNTGEHNERKLQ